MSIRLAFLLLLVASAAAAQGRAVRARDLGVPFDGTAGPLNAITDVKGVMVGHSTIVRGAGRLRVGQGPVRTGVTAIFPRGRDNLAPVFAGWFSLNGNGVDPADPSPAEFSAFIAKEITLWGDAVKVAGVTLQ